MQSTLAPLGFRDARRRLRRRRRVEFLLALAPHLADHDRLLIEQVYHHGVRVADLARVTGSERCRLYRRLGSLLKRVDQPVVAYLLEHHDLLPRHLQAAADLVFLQGTPIRQAARRLGRSLHQLRQQIAQVRILAQR